MGFLRTFWNGLRKVLGLILPFFSRGRDFRGMGRVVKWVLHFVLLALILVVLYFVGRYFKLDIVLQNLSVVWLRQFFLPILFLLLYALSWLGYVLWKLLLPEEDVSGFPDIDEAWEEAVRALNKKGVDLTELPLFLVLGRPTGGENGFFKAAKLEMTVNGAPARPDAPLHVYSCPEGIFVTSAGASLLGRQAELLAETPAPAGDGAAAPDRLEMSFRSGNADDVYASIGPKGLLKDIQGILAQAREQGRGANALTDEEKRHIRLLSGEDQTDFVQQRLAKPRPALLKKQEEVELHLARFRHLCRLLIRDRRPFCPVNGMLVLVPFASTDSDDDATQTAGVCQQELLTARKVLQMHWPTVALFCDLERAQGFQEFLKELPGNETRARRLGKGFPLIPDLSPEALTPALESLADWATQGVIGHWIYKQLHVETTAEAAGRALEENGELYKLLAEFHERHRRLGRILARGLVPQGGDQLPLLSGCYLAATGTDPLREQAFVAGVVRKLFEDQSFVSWTDEALAEEADLQRWTGYGYVAMTILVLALVGLGAWLLLKK